MVSGHKDEFSDTFLRQQLEAYNVSRAHVDKGIDLAIFIRDRHDDLVAGIYGWLWGACLELVLLWVHESLRGQGVGERLVRALEAEARARGCRQIMLETFSFQAPDFYRKLGYETFGVVEGYADDHQKIFMQKRLADDFEAPKV